MNWIEVRLVGIDGEGIEAVWETLSRFAQGSPVIEETRATETSTTDIDVPRTLKAYLPATLAGTQSLRQLREALWHLGQLYPLPEPEIRHLAETDWRDAWKQHYHRTRVGQRLIIAPAWDEQLAGEDEIVIWVDPGMAFGTGQHPSTQLSLRLLEGTLRPGDHVLDVGTGSGILAIAAAKLGAGAVRAVDIDETAVEAARENAVRNDITCAGEPISNTFCVAHGSIERYNGPFELIMINILAEVIVDLLPAAKGRLTAGGRLILAGIIAEHAPMVRAALVENDLHVLRCEQENDWIALLVERKARQ